MPPDIQIRSTDTADSPWIRQFTKEQWGDEFIAVHGAIYYPHQLPGFLAMDKKGAIVGYASYNLAPPVGELVSINAIETGKGVGSALLRAVVAEARQAGCCRLWLVTTNDNLDALGFYQKRGFCLVAVYAGAIEQSRKIKPSIPMFGSNGIPIRDELELELVLDG